MWVSGVIVMYIAAHKVLLLLAKRYRLSLPGYTPLRFITQTGSPIYCWLFQVVCLAPIFFKIYLFSKQI